MPASAAPSVPRWPPGSPGSEKRHVGDPAGQSLRRGSLNRRLLDAAGHELPAGARLVTWAELADVPPFDEDVEHAPAAAVTELRAAIGAADAVLVATPEYNGSLPSALKNALDWASRPYGTSVLTGRRVAVIGAGPGPGGAADAQADLLRVLDRASAEVVAGPLPVPEGFRAFDENGRLLDPVLRDALSAVLTELRDSAAAAANAGAGAGA